VTVVVLETIMAIKAIHTTVPRIATVILQQLLWICLHLLDGVTKAICHTTATMTSFTRWFTMCFTRVGYKEIMGCLDGGVEMVLPLCHLYYIPHYIVYKGL
jgi:hypothetical protein